MGDKSAIQWTDATWNPTTGCDRVSPGCAHCYALDFSPRLKAMAVANGARPDAPYMRDGDPKTSGPGFGLMVHPDRLGLPLRWKRPRRIFVNSMSDLFHPEVPDDFIDHVFATMAWAQQHVFQVLTKRPERMLAYLTQPPTFANPVEAGLFARYDREAVVESAMCDACNGGQLCRSSEDCELIGAPGWPLPNLWLGTSIENDRWTARADDLREAPAAVRFLSLEPLLGPLPSLNLNGIDWVIVGGESGPEHRPFDPDWARDLRDRCVAAGVAFFFKQHGGRTPKAGGRELDGRTWDEFPRQAVEA